MPKHIRTGDQVIVTSGDHKGQTGEVIKILNKSDKVIVKGINVKTRHVRPTQINPKGGVVNKEMPMHISNVSPVVDGKPTRVRFETQKDGSKNRVAVRGGKSLGQVSGPNS